MRYTIRPSPWLLLLFLTASAALLISGFPVMEAANTNPPPFDFNDTFYAQNGVNGPGLRERACNPDRPATHAVLDPPSPDPATRNTCRILQTTGGFDASGNLIYYSIMAPVFPNDFTNNAAGQRALQIANDFRAFLFPKCVAPGTPGSVLVRAGCAALKSPALANRRQDNVFDTRNGYFSNNPLGLWILAFVVYTDAAFNTPEGQSELAKIAATNGTDLDGTPILDDASSIDNLVQKGFARILTRAQNGGEGFPWVL